MAFLIAGFFGGLLRGTIGVIKYLTSYKDVKINLYYFLGMITISGILGYVCAWVARDVSGIFLEIKMLPVSFALVAGYAGGDFLENLVKIGMKDTNIYDIGEKIKKIALEKLKIKE
jgi:hypothetical protein